MMHFLAFSALVIGAVLFLTASNRIIRHDEASDGVMVQCASGFVLVVAAVTAGVVSL